MNNIITLNDLSQAIAEKLGLTPEQASQLITETLASVQNKVLTEGSSVTLPELGEFSVTDRRFKFTPRRELADCVNEPFNFFEPVVYDTGVEMPASDPIHIEVPEKPESGDATHQQSPATTVEMPDQSPLSETKQTVVPDSQNRDNTPSPEVAEVSSAEETVEVLDSGSINNPDTNDEQPVDFQDQPTTYYESERGHRFNPWVAFFCGLLTGMILICIAVYFLYPPLYNSDNDEYYAKYGVEAEDDSMDSGVSSVIESSDSIHITNEEVEIQNTGSNNVLHEKELTDTVTTTYFLASMSRKYYGRMEFWVYIYLDNLDKISNPDQIAPGTIVTIPPRSKYDIDPDDPKSVSNAKEAIQEVYSQLKSL